MWDPPGLRQYIFYTDWKFKKECVFKDRLQNSHCVCLEFMKIFLEQD